MARRLAGCGVAILTAVACGGVAQQSSDHVVGVAGESQSGSGGNEASPAGFGSSGSGAPNPTRGGGGSVNIDVPIAGDAGAPPGIRDGNACQFAPPTCNVVDQFIDLEDGTRLSYPLDTSCGQCNFKCEVCDELTCSLWALATTGCGAFNLSIAACAGLDGKPPCLNSASNTPYYVDASGKRWEQVAVTGSEDQLPSPVVNGPVDLALTVKIGDGVTTRTLAATAHVCSEFFAVLVICK